MDNIEKLITALEAEAQADARCGRSLYDRHEARENARKKLVQAIDEYAGARYTEGYDDGVSDEYRSSTEMEG